MEKQELTLVAVPEMACPGCGEKHLEPVWVVGRGNNAYGQRCGGCHRVYVPYYNENAEQFGLRPAALGGTEKDYIGLAEAAEILGWDKRKVSTYIKRGKFPEPVVRLKSGPIWERRQIEEYKEGMRE